MGIPVDTDLLDMYAQQIQAIMSNGFLFLLLVRRSPGLALGREALHLFPHLLLWELCTGSLLLPTHTRGLRFSLDM